MAMIRIDKVIKTEIMKRLTGLTDSYKTLLLTTNDFDVRAHFFQESLNTESGNISELCASHRCDYSKILKNRYQASVKIFKN